MGRTFRAVEVVAPGRLELVERPVPEPAVGEVLLAVEACGVCGADRGDVGRAAVRRRVPGHEVVGRIVALGPGVAPEWTVGRRVGVGRFGGHCGRCLQCRRGLFSLCDRHPVTGVSRDGGYAEWMTADQSGLVGIPDGISSAEAAPVLCAGVAVFNGLRRSGAVPGDTVAVLGIGGLGHLAVQYAARMGFRVVALGRGQDVADRAAALGAHHWIDTEREGALRQLQDHGGVAALLAATGAMDVVASFLPALQPRGRLVLLGTGRDPLPVAPGLLIGGDRTVVGSITGSPDDAERTLGFGLLIGARPWVETAPLERAQAAFDRMRSGDAQFRMVLTIDDDDR